MEIALSTEVEHTGRRDVVVRAARDIAVDPTSQTQEHHSPNPTL